MCTLALYFQQSRHYPLVVAANRDEFLKREATAPMRVREDPWVVAGLDLVSGGTWLGTNAHGLTVGLLNRRVARAIDPTRRSRGLLCLETLVHESADAAIAAVQRAPSDEYNPFNLLVASPVAAFVAQNLDGRITATRLAPGLHLLTNLDLNDPTCPRIAKSHHLFQAAARHLDGGAIEPLLDDLRAVLSDHSTPLDPRGETATNNLCVHLGEYGTRSSSVLVYAAGAQHPRYFHAAGPPCTHRYEEVGLPEVSRH